MEKNTREKEKKLSLSLIKTLRHVRVEVRLHAFLTSSRDSGDCLDRHNRRQNPGTHLTVVSVRLKADVLEETKNIYLCWESNTDPLTVRIHYTD
jgi:hypothetical protein